MDKGWRQRTGLYLNAYGLGLEAQDRIIRIALWLEAEFKTRSEI